MNWQELKKQIENCPIGQQGEIYAMFRAKKHEKDAGGFDISADDKMGTYHVAEFSEGGNYDDGTYWTNPEKNRQAMIAVWNAMPELFDYIEELEQKLNEQTND